MFYVDRSPLAIANTEMTIVVTPTTQNYLADVNLISTTVSSNITIDNSTAYLDSVAIRFLYLVNCILGTSTVSLLGLTVPGSNFQMPKIKGYTQLVSYTVLSGNGNIVSNGSVYTGIKTVSDQPNYFVQENDGTILSNNVNIFIFNPLDASTSITDSGKLLTIKNIGNQPITLTFQDNSVFDPILSLPSSSTVTYQSNGTLWYLISST